MRDVNASPGDQNRLAITYSPLSTKLTKVGCNRVKDAIYRA